MIRSRLPMGLLPAILALALHLWPFAPVARAQGSRKDDIIFNSRGMPLAGATVRVCTMPATGQPCTPLALIYSDAALTQALANPTTTDGLGNYFFYAAPGKYEIEVSGPSITTRQIPSVILPSDPIAPSFSTVTSTGAISAFSLNLTGNLTVNGNTTVAGSLGSGTLNLTNQATPPGAASSGTVNLYTKTTDKRIYYKDDSGTEIGPVANTTGAQTNVTNTFTAPQNIDADFHNKGPNPWFDITRYGGVASTQTTTGSITSGSATLTLASAIDFANGQGIVVYGAGSATALGTPGAPTVAPLGTINGATTYNYQIVCEDYSGGLTAASATGSTTTGMATLGVQPTINVTNLVRSAGVTTYTTSAAHNLVAGQPANVVSNNNSDQQFEGVFTVASTPTSTTFTVNQATAPNTASAAPVGAMTVQGLAYNKVTWTPCSGGNLLRTWIYRNSALVGVTPGIDGYYEDYGIGFTANTLPSYLPSTPPASAQAGYLATTISSGGGSTSLTLAASASTTVSSKSVYHDNVPAFEAAKQAAINASGAGQTSGTVYCPNANSNVPFEINSAWQMSSPGVNFVTFELACGLGLSQPIILTSNVKFEGLPGSANQAQIPAFGKGGYAIVSVSSAGTGRAYPYFYVPTTRSNITLRNIDVYDTANQVVSFYTDEASDGSGSTNILFDNDYFNNGAYGEGVNMAGGFGFYFDKTGFATTGAVFGSPYAVRLTDRAYTTTGALPDIDYFTNCWFGGSGIQMDNIPKGALGGATGNVKISQTIYESGRTPLMRLNISGNQFAAEFQFDTSDVADFLGGWSTPMFDLSNSTNLTGVSCNLCGTLNGNMPIFSGSPSPLTVNGGIPSVAGVGSSSYVATASGALSGSAGGGLMFQDMHNVQVTMTGQNLIAPMAAPSAPTSVTVAAGGSLATGHTYYVGLTALDADGIVSIGTGETILGPFTAASSQTNTGNQSVSVAFTLPAGAVACRAFIGQDNTLVASIQYFNPCTSPISITSLTNNLGPNGGASAPTLTTAGLYKLKPAGQMLLSGETFSASPRGVQNAFLPGALTSTWTATTWTLDKAITVTRVEVQAKTAPAACTTNAVVRLSDGATPVNVTLSAAANSSGAIAQNYAAGAAVTVSVQTAAAGCTTSPADANVVVQYRMQ